MNAAEPSYCLDAFIRRRRFLKLHLKKRGLDVRSTFNVYIKKMQYKKTTSAQSAHVIGLERLRSKPTNFKTNINRLRRRCAIM